MRFSVPYNHQPDYADKVIQPFGHVIHDVYLPIHVSVAATGRPWRGPHSRSAYDDQLDQLAHACEPFGISYSFIANLPPETPAQGISLVDEVLRLHERFPSAHFGLVSYELAVQLHKTNPDIELYPSTVVHITNPTAAWYWKTHVGAKSVVLCRSINKRPEIIRAIKRTGLKVRMVINDRCVPSCPAELEHVTYVRRYDYLGLSWPGKPDPMQGECRPEVCRLKKQNRWFIAQKDVLPGHLHHLEGLVDYVKLAGRQHDSTKIAAELERNALMEELDNPHPVFPYSEPPEAYEKLTTCDRVCDLCGWCHENLVIPDRSR